MNQPISVINSLLSPPSLSFTCLIFMNFTWLKCQTNLSVCSKIDILVFIFSLQGYFLFYLVRITFWKHVINKFLVLNRFFMNYLNNVWSWGAFDGIIWCIYLPLAFKIAHWSLPPPLYVEPCFQLRGEGGWGGVF